MNDQIVLTIENWHLKLVNPDDGTKFQKKEYPIFVWESTGYKRFKIQFSTVASFEVKYVRTFPRSDNDWIYETSYTVEKWQAWRLNRLRKGHQPLYWRVLAQDRDGNEKISQTRRIFVETKKGYVKEKKKNNKKR